MRFSGAFLGVILAAVVVLGPGLARAQRQPLGASGASKPAAPTGTPSSTSGEADTLKTSPEGERKPVAAAASPDTSTVRVPAADESVYVVQRRAYSKSGRFEFTPVFLTAINPKFVGYVGVGLSAAYHFQENLALEFMTSVYAWAFYSDLVYEVWLYERLAPEEVDLKKLLYFNALSLQFSALYGKLELYGILVDYDFYASAGLGFAVTREPCFPAGVGDCSEESDVDRGLRFPDRALDAYKITGNLGLGARVFFHEMVGARVEFRNIAYSDRKVNSTTAGSQGVAGTDIRNTMMLFVGVSVLL